MSFRGRPTGACASSQRFQRHPWKHLTRNVPSSEEHSRPTALALSTVHLLAVLQADRGIIHALSLSSLKVSHSATTTFLLVWSFSSIRTSPSQSLTLSTGFGESHDDWASEQIRTRVTIRQGGNRRLVREPRGPLAR